METLIGATVIAAPHRRSSFATLAAFARRTWLTVSLATASLVGVVVLAAARTPEAWDALRADPTLAKARSFEAGIYLAAGIRTALTALIFSLIYLLVAKVIGSIYRRLADRWRDRTALQMLLELAVYLVLAAVALHPISTLMEFDSVRALSADWRAVILLLTINGLFFFLGVSYIDYIITESHKTYATSAEFRSSRRAVATREASWQFLLSRWASVYYFVLTFTMVPEFIEPSTSIIFGEALGENIVKAIFHTIFHDRGAISLLWLQTLAFVSTALVFRLLIDAIVLSYDLKIGLEERAA